MLHRDEDEVYTPTTVEMAFLFVHLFKYWDERIENPTDFVLDFLLAYYPNISDQSKLQILSLFL